MPTTPTTRRPTNLPAPSSALGRLGPRRSEGESDDRPLSRDTAGPYSSAVATYDSLDSGQPESAPRELLAGGATDDFGYKALEQPISAHDLHATMLHLLGMDHRQLTYRFSGRDMRLTDVAGTLIPQIVG